jgi:hypothetical protein
VRQAVALSGGRANKEETMFRSGLVKSACVAMLISGFSAPPAGAIEMVQGSGPAADLNDGLISKVVVYHRGVTAVGPRGGVYHRGGTWAGHGGYGYRGYGYHGGYGYGGYGYRPYGYGAAAAIGAAAVGAAVVAPHCWINPYGVRVCN